MTRPLSPRTSVLDEGEVLGYGSYSIVRRSEVQVTSRSGKTKRKLQIVMRAPHGAKRYEHAPQKDAWEEVMTWSTLRRIGAPVIPLLRYDEATGRMYQTDLSQNETHYVLSATNASRWDDEIRQRIQDGEWKDPAPNSMDVLSAHADIALLCARHRIRFSVSDVFFQIVNKSNRHTSVLLGDYKHVHPASFRKNYNPSQENLEEARNAVLAQAEVLGLSYNKIGSYFRERGLQAPIYLFKSRWRSAER